MGLTAFTNYDNQSIATILNDMKKLQLESENFVRTKQDIFKMLEELRNQKKFSDGDIYEIYGFIVALNDFFKFLENIFIPANRKIIIAIKDDSLFNRHLVDDLLIFQKDGLTYKQTLAREFPSNIECDISEEAKKLGNLYYDIDEMIGKIMAIGGITHKLQENINIDNPAAVSLIILKACEKLINYQKIFKSKPKENDYNTFLSALLDMHPNITVKDQTLRGESATGKDFGEVDILLEIFQNKISIIEALKLESLNRNIIIEHINRVKNYDKSGNPENYIVVYYRGNDFINFEKKYLETLQSKEIRFNSVIVSKDEDLSKNHIKVIDMSYQIHADYAKITHIILNIPQ